MFQKLKGVLKIDDEDAEHQNKKKVQPPPDISFMKVEELQAYKKSIEELKLNIEQLTQICSSNKTDIVSFIKSQQNGSGKQKIEKQEKTNAQNAQNGQNKDESEEQEYTFMEDLGEIKEILKEAILHITKLTQVGQEVKSKVNTPSIGSSGNIPGNNQNSEIIAKYAAEIKQLRKSEQNNKQILNTLKQQTSLLSKETKELQQKNKELQNLSNNLQEEKKVLLEMRNLASTDTTPNAQVEKLKSQCAQYQKRLALQKSKLGQKQKEVESIKKKLEQERQSLQKIADELKQKELQSKRIRDKYQRSKTEIRKFREEKTEFIKKLNLQIHSLGEQLKQSTTQLTETKAKLSAAVLKIENLQEQVSRNENRGSQLTSIKDELMSVRSEMLQMSIKLQERQGELTKLKQQNDQLQNKRRALLEALQKPIAHQLRTLEKIIRALQKLYKQYISVVFEQGNVVGFQSKITYILSNVRQIKQDLLL